jgi:hypothetical protein
MGGTIDDEITVERDAMRLIAFSWQGQRYPIRTVQIMGTQPTRWWDGQGERTYVRVTTKKQIYELYFDHERKVWVLSRKL